MWFNIRCRWVVGMTVLLASATGQAQMPELPKPTPEHGRLARFAGEWVTVAETVPPPGQEAFRCEGAESSHMLGGFWLSARQESHAPGMKVEGQFTVGYDPATKKYTGTFLCSMDSTLWKYDGEMNDKGDTLTLLTTGPSMINPGKTARYREVLHLKDENHKTFTSYIEGDDGQWVKMMVAEYTRKPK